MMVILSQEMVVVLLAKLKMAILATNLILKVFAGIWVHLLIGRYINLMEKIC